MSLNLAKTLKVSHTQNIIELRHLLSAKCYIQGPTLIFDLSDFTLRVECTSRTGVGLLSSSSRDSLSSKLDPAMLNSLCVGRGGGGGGGGGGRVV